MPNPIRIRRRTGDTTAPTTAQLKSSELAYNEVSGYLYYGKGNNGSNVPTSVVVIGGESVPNPLGDRSATPRVWATSRAQNLVTNGQGLMASNYNFPAFTFDTAQTHGGGGSFKVAAGTSVNPAFSDEYIPVDIEKFYRMVMWARSGEDGGVNYNAASMHYAGVACYDIDNNNVDPWTYARYGAATDTTLAVQLVNGATTITLANATGWQNGGAAHERQIVWYGYANSKGYTYPNYTYSRTGSWLQSGYQTTGCWAASGISGNVITLAAPWAGGTIAAGTAVRNAVSGGTFKYITLANTHVPNTWTRYEGFIGGIDTTGGQDPNKFPYGTAFARLLFLGNYSGNTGNNFRLSDITFSELSSRNLEPATTSIPGVVSTTTQSFAGNKTFTGAVTAASFTGSVAATNLTGTIADARFPAYDTKALGAGNWGQHDVHGTYVDFNSVNQWGSSFIQGAANGPGVNSAGQYYQMYLSLGSQYGPTTYALQLAFPRNPTGMPYFAQRQREGGTWGAWSKFAAGSADTATNISNVGTVTLASGSESNSIYATAPGYVSGQPVRLLNFDWYGNGWALGNIRGSGTNSLGLGVFAGSVEKYRFTLTGLTTEAGVGATLGGVFKPTGVSETYAAVSVVSNQLTLDFAAATVFNASLTANVSTGFNLTNLVAGRVNAFTIFLKQDATGGRTINWYFGLSKTLLWAGGVAHVMTTTANKTDIVTGVSNDGGSTWHLMVAAQNM